MSDVPWQDSVTQRQLNEMIAAGERLGAKAGDTIRAEYRLVDGERVMIPGSERLE